MQDTYAVLRNLNHFQLVNFSGSVGYLSVVVSDSYSCDVPKVSQKWPENSFKIQKHRGVRALKPSIPLSNMILQ